MTDVIDKIIKEFNEKIRFLEMAGFDLEFLKNFLTHSLEKAIIETKKEVLEEVKRGILEKCLKCNEFKKEVNPSGICIPCCKKLQKKYGIEEEKEL